MRGACDAGLFRVTRIDNPARCEMNVAQFGIRGHGMAGGEFVCVSAI